MRAQHMWIVLAILLAAMPAARAHKMKVFATASGREISGEVYYTTGGNPTNMAIAILAPGGKQKVAQTEVDKDGAFSVTVTHRADYIVRADAGMGHVATASVSASDFDAALPLLGQDAATPDAVSQKPEAASAPRQSAGQHAPNAEAGDAAATGDLSRRVAALTKQVEGLRGDIDRMSSRARIQDAVAGIGYILGLAGLAVLLMRKKK